MHRLALSALIPLLLALLAAPPAAAAETAWQELAPGTRARLIAGEVLKGDRTTLVALEIEMPPETKTYWRVPGETGIPTEIDTSRSTGIGGSEILWPYPTIDIASGFLDYVYYGPTVLPIELTLTAAAAVLEADVIMGVCSDICIPVRASFSLPLDFAGPDRPHGLRIAQALAETPLDWSDPREPIGAVRFDALRDAVEVRIGDDRVDPLSVIADAGAAGQLFGAPQKSPDGKSVWLPLLGGSGHEGVKGKPIQLTFMTQMGPFAVRKRVD